jgi:ribose/xylose/arabinose/galactoside ABC-type transport system permease subunit
VKDRVAAWLRLPWVGPAVALVCVYVVFTLLAPETFARGTNLVTMARQTVVVAIAATGMLLVMVKGGIDLSVGSSVALTTVVIARLLDGGWGPASAALAGIAVATLAGCVNGALVVSLRIAPFIVTLGTMSALRGAAKGLAGEQKIDADPRGLDELMAVFSAESGSAGLPAGIWIALVTALLVALLVAYTRFGRHLVAIGSNELTARLCGVAVSRVTIIAYSLAGALAGLAGVMEFATLTVGDPTDSIGLELEVIAAVVIGGGSLSGGQGSISGALVGALLLTVIKTGCTHVGVPNWVQEILTGAIIVVAMGLDRLRRRKP